MTQFLKPAAINPRLVAFTYMRKYRSFSQQYPLAPAGMGNQGALALLAICSVFLSI